MKFGRLTLAVPYVVRGLASPIGEAIWRLNCEISDVLSAKNPRAIGSYEHRRGQEH